MTITKSIDLFAPYVAGTFNQKTETLSGINGLLSGGVITVTAATDVDIAPYAFLQDGLVINQDQVTSLTTIPDFSTFTANSCGIKRVNPRDPSSRINPPTYGKIWNAVSIFRDSSTVLRSSKLIEASNPMRNIPIPSGLLIN